MSTSTFSEFNLPRNAYAAFDATSLKQLITNRLKASGLFPDIDYEGSNINGLTDVVAYTYHVLLFYLNQTASNSMFTQADILENMNKIVSIIGYKPTGNHTATLNVSVSANETISPKSYTIRKFSNFTIQNITYSFNKDITFQKTSTGTEYIESIGANNLAYQGVFREYPLYTAIGELNEQFTLNIDYPVDMNSSKMIDETNIFVYVRDYKSQMWSEWTEIGSLYLADNISKVFEKRLNEYGHYDIKFGDGVNGKTLNTGDYVQIYYLESDGVKGIVGSKTAQQGKLVLFNSPFFREISNDTDDKSDYMTADQCLNLKFDNMYASVSPTYMEGVDSIRKNAPLIFSAQNRTVTTNDFESFVEKNFSNIIQSVKAVSNKTYTSEYLAYYYDLGLQRPNLDDKLLFNQISFNDVCDFNNVYIFGVPRLGAIQNETTPIELFFAQKQSIVDKLNEVKMVNQNIVINDPVYLAFDIGLPLLSELNFTSDIRDETKIRITRSTDQIISKEQIKSSVFNYIKNFFSQSNNNLGQFLDLAQLSFDILNLNGVKALETVRTNNNIEYKTSKLNFVYWNPLYPESTVESLAQNTALKYFQFPFFYKISNLINKIEVV